MSHSRFRIAFIFVLIAGYVLGGASHTSFFFKSFSQHDLTKCFCAAISHPKEMSRTTLQVQFWRPLFVPFLVIFFPSLAFCLQPYICLWICILWLTCVCSKMPKAVQAQHSCSAHPRSKNYNFIFHSLPYVPTDLCQRQKLIENTAIRRVTQKLRFGEFKKTNMIMSLKWVKLSFVCEHISDYAFNVAREENVCSQPHLLCVNTCYTACLSLVFLQKMQRKTTLA